MKDANNHGSIQKCLRCKHKWISRVNNPIRCPNCKSPYWKKQKVMVHYVRNEGVSLPDMPPKSVMFLGDVNPIINLPSKLFPQMKNRIMVAMRDKLPIKFELKDGEITGIV